MIIASPLAAQIFINFTCKTGCIEAFPQAFQRRYSNYCLSPGIARLEHDLKMLLTIGCMFFPSVVRCFGISIIFHLKTAFLCPLLCPAYEGPKPSQKSIIFYLKTVFHAFGICRTHGVTNEYLLFENHLVELSGFPHEIISSI